ncbi:MAG: hypothetical protein WBW73_28530 [Rhodoplanes sp.]
MAEYDPAFSRNLRYPFIVWSGVSKFELAFWVVVKFDSKRWSRRPDCLGKALSKIAIKVERQ